MNKMTKYFLALTSAFSLIFASCGDLNGDDSVRTETKYISLDKNTAYIQVAISDASAELASRTLVPEIKAANDFALFSKFILKAENDNSSSDVNFEVSYTSDESGSNGAQTAYQKLTTAHIPLPLVDANAGENYTETWKFTLTGYYDGSDENSSTVFKGETTETGVKAGSNPISFSLKRQNQYVYSSGTGSISCNLNFTDATVTKVEAKLFNQNDSETPVTTEAFTVADKKASIVFSDVTAGKYLLKMTFLAENSVLVGSMNEYTYVLSGLTSKLVGTSSTVDVNATYTLTYKKGASAFAEWKDGYTAPATFSRKTAVTLPVASDMADSFTADNIFLGWYKSSNFAEDSKISKIDENTIVQNTTLYGKFVNAKEMPTVEGVKFSYESGETDPKVGYTVTASPYYTEGGEPKDFLGTITSWKWYYGDEGNWTEITSNSEAAKGKITTTDESPAGDEIAASSSLTISPLYLGKKFKVELVQKYSVTPSSLAGVYDIADNTSAKESSTSEVVAGTLALKDNFQIFYISDNAEDRDSYIVRSETALDSAKVAWASAKSNAYDAHAGEGWLLKDLPCPTESAPVVIFAENAKAPDSSDYVASTLRVYGYKDLNLTDTKQVFVRVKYAAPTKAEALSLFWKKGEDGTKDVLDGITKGKVAFKKNTITRGEDALPIYYGGSKTAMENPKANMAEAALSDDCQVALASVTGGIALQGKTGLANASGLSVGEIAYSDFTGLTAEDLADYTGTRLLLDKLTGESFTVGTTGTVKAYCGENLLHYTDIQWQWTFGNTFTSVSDNDNTITHAFIQQDYINAASGATSDSDPNVTIKATRTYPYDGPKSEIFTAQLTRGTIKTDSISVAYIGKAKKIGDSVVPAELKINGKPLDNNTNDEIVPKEITVEAIKSAVKWTDAANTVAGVDLTFSATGYTDVAVIVRNIPVKQAAPEIGSSSDGFGMSEEKNNISIGYAQFKEAASVKDKYEFTRVDSTTLNTFFEARMPSELKELYGTSAEGKDLKNSMSELFANAGETGWHAITMDEFTLPTSGCISVRQKMRGQYDFGSDGLITGYYDTESNTWVFGSKVFTAIEFAADGSTCSVREAEAGGGTGTVVNIMDASSSVDMGYDESKHAGVRGVKTFTVTVDHIDMALSSSKAGGKVTIEPAAGYTVLSWRIDGMNVSDFIAAEGLSSSAVTTDGGKLVFTLSELKEGTYQVTAYSKDSQEITYSAGASIVVSK